MTTFYPDTVCYQYLYITSLYNIAISNIGIFIVNMIYEIERILYETEVTGRLMFILSLLTTGIYI